MTGKTRTFRNGNPASKPSRIGFKKILVPVDFSPASQNALRHALRLAEKFNAEEIILLHVLTVPAWPSLAPLPPAAMGPEADSNNATKKLRALVSAAQKQKSGRIHFTTRAGLPTHEIVEAARETNADVIVISAHGHTGWKHFCIGSTAERVVRAAPCPVLVVREKEPEFSFGADSFANYAPAYENAR